MHRIAPTRVLVPVLFATVLLAAAMARSAVAPPHAADAQSFETGRGALRIYGGRTPAQQRSGVGAKLDAALAEITRHQGRLGAAPGARELRALHPAARFAVAPATGITYVAVDATTRGDPQALKAALVRLGLQHPAVYLNDVGGWLPLQAIDAAARLPQLHTVRAALARTRSGAVSSQGDYVQGSAALRSSNPSLTGSGITVGILSDSYDCYVVYAAPNSGVPASGNAGYASNGFTADAARDQATGDLPASSSISVLAEAGALNKSTCMDYGAPYLLPYGDEGRAMMQIVHDVAPGAKLAFHTAVESEADFANGIEALASAGARIIADDVGYSDEPYFQDGLIAQAIDKVNAAGVAYFSSAGNDGSNGYDNTAPSFATASSSPANETLLNFDTSGAGTTTQLAVSIPQLAPGDFISMILEWDDPYVTGAPHSGGASSQMDLCLTGSASGLIASPENPDNPNGGSITPVGNNTMVCTGANNPGVDPYQVLVIGFPADATSGSACPGGITASLCSAQQTVYVQIGHAGGRIPGRIKLVIADNGAGISYPGPITPTGATLQGHPGAGGAMAVGAVFWYQTPDCGAPSAVLEYFSAKGGDPILFDSTGMRLASATMRPKPDIAGPDGGSNTFLGFTLGAAGAGNCLNSASYPNFFGTSAATPHVAGIAALLMNQFPGIKPAALYTALQSGTLPLTNSTTVTPTAVNYTGGYGLVQAGAAFAALPAAPQITLKLGASNITTGGSTALTWSVTNGSACMASGSWSGAQGTSGSLTVAPTSTGSYTYSLTCSNASGSASASQVLTVSMPSSSGGGGGGGGTVDGGLLLALGLLAGRRRARRQA